MTEPDQMMIVREGSPATFTCTAVAGNNDDVCDEMFFYQHDQSGA